MRKLLFLLPLFLIGCVTLPPSRQSASFSDCFYEKSQLSSCVNGGGLVHVQLTQPPGGITGNLPPWVGGNGSTGQVLTSRGALLAPTFQAAAAGGTPAGSTGQVQYNNAGAFGANSGFTYNGSNSITVSDQVNAVRVNVTGVTAPTTGIYFPGSNRLAFSTGGIERGSFGSTGFLGLNFGMGSGGTKFTTTGCSISATTGGGTAGTFTLGANTCTVVVTLNGAASIAANNGWTCQAHDRTAPTVLIGGESSATTTTASFTIPAGAGTSDVISFSCTGLL